MIGLESMGLPLPGETMLVAAAIYAAATGGIDINFVVLAAALGAILGDNAGYLLGRRFGTVLLERHGWRIGLTARRLRVGQHLFGKYGGGVVFLGRFTALLRTLAALLAGANLMPWRNFLIWNAAGGIAWTAAYGYGTYALGDHIFNYAGPAGLAMACGAVLLIVGAAMLMKRQEARLEAAAARDTAD